MRRRIGLLARREGRGRERIPPVDIVPIIDRKGNRHNVGRTRDPPEPLVGATVGTPLAREKLDDIIDRGGSERPGSKIAAGHHNHRRTRGTQLGSSDWRKP
jgi:hypothetical protein